MSFKDYSRTPSQNTTLGDGSYIGPNMLRNVVRPSLQQLAADGRELYDFVVAQNGGEDLPSFVQSGAGALARNAQDKMREFLSPEDKEGPTDAAWLAVLNDEPGRPISARSLTPYTFATPKFPAGTVNVRGPATIKPSGDVYGFWATYPNPSTTSAVTAGYTQGSEQITVSAPANFIPGYWVKIECDDTLNGPNQYPLSWAKVLATDTGTGIVTLSKGLVCTYRGNVTAKVYANTIFQRDFILQEVVFDGSLNTKSDELGQAVRLGGYRKVDLDISVENFTANNAMLSPVLLFGCHEADLRIRASKNISKTSIVNVQECGILRPDIEVEGSGFGATITRVDRIHGGHINVTGQIAQEQVATLTASLGSSVRGVKFTGCGRLDGTTIFVSGCDTGLRWSSGFQANFGSVTLENCGVTESSFAFLVGAEGGYETTANNSEGITVPALNIVGTTGTHIGVTSDKGRISISDFFLKNCTKSVVYAYNANGFMDDFILDDGIIDTWDTGGTSPHNAAIFCPFGGSFTNITFRHTDATKPCFSSTMTAGRMFTIAGIRRPNGNPLFPGGKDVDTTGTATIASGATSVSVNHNLIKQPSLSEVSFTANNPTNDPGHISVTVSATQITFTCRADPGASGLVINWRAALKMPFTA